MLTGSNPNNPAYCTRWYYGELTTGSNGFSLLIGMVQATILVSFLFPFRLGLRVFVVVVIVFIIVVWRGLTLATHGHLGAVAQARLLGHGPLGCESLGRGSLRHGSLGHSRSSALLTLISAP